MSRITTGFAALVALTLVPAHLGADVKTRQKDSMKFEGMMGRVMSMAGVGGDPATSTVSVKGTRMASMGDRAGQIIDLAEMRVVLTLTLRQKGNALEETVKSEADMKAAAEQSGGGGGIGGALAGRLMRRGSQQPRSKTMTMTHEVLSVDTTVAADDVQLPAGFKEKK